MSEQVDDSRPRPATSGSTDEVGKLVYLLPADYQRTSESDVLDLRSVLKSIRSGRWPALLMAAAFSVIAAGYVWLQPDVYRAEVLAARAPTGADQGLASRLGGLGGLAGLAGITLESGEAIDPVAVLESRDFTRQFVEDAGILEELLSNRHSVAAWMPGSGATVRGDIWDAVEVFRTEVRSVSIDKKSGLISIAIDWTDPELAADWANSLVGKLNLEMRTRALSESDKNIGYLRQELAQADVVAIQQSIGRLIESELQKKMVARGNSEYALRVIDSAQTPRRASSPRRVAVVLLAFIGGLISGFLFSLVRERSRVLYGQSAGT